MQNNKDSIFQFKNKYLQLKYILLHAYLQQLPAARAQTKTSYTVGY